MRSATSVSINYDFATRKTGIAVRTSDNKFAGRVNKVFYIVVEKFLYRFGFYLCQHARNYNVYYVLANLCKHFFIGCFLIAVLCLHKLIVLCGNYNRINAHRLVVVVILNRYLAFCIRTEISHNLSFAANLCKHSENLVCKRKRKRHVIRRFVCGVTKHYSLVARTLIHRIFALYAATYVGTLLVNSV